MSHASLWAFCGTICVLFYAKTSKKVKILRIITKSSRVGECKTSKNIRNLNKHVKNVRVLSKNVRILSRNVEILREDAEER